MTNEPRSIYTVVTDFLRDVLTDYCVTQVMDQDYRASDVYVGRMRNDPTAARIYIEINIADPGNTENMPAWTDEPSQKGSQYWAIASYEIGGGERWTRRFSVELKAYFNNTDESRERAMNIALWQFMQAQKAIRDHKYPLVDGQLLKDDVSGEIALQMLISRNHAYETGGDGDWMWKGKFYIDVTTEIP